MLLCALALLIPVPVLYRISQRRFDVFEPINFFVLGLFVLFLVRPLVELSHPGARQFEAYSDAPGFEKALLIALVGVAGLYIGYALSYGRVLGQRIPRVPTAWSPTTLGVLVFSLVMVGALLFAAFAAQVGQGLDSTVSYFKGRSTEVRTLGQSSAYFYYGPYLVVPATFLLLLGRQSQRRGRWLLGAAITGVLALLITVPRGDRTFVLAFLLPLLVLPYLRSGRRPKVRNLLLLIVIVIPAITVLGEVRNVSSRDNVSGRVATAFSRPDRSLLEFMLGQDTSMFTVLSLTAEVVPARLDHAPGRVISATLASPVPGLLWPAKPIQGDQVVYNVLFPDQAEVTRSGNASGFLGGFYYDGGLIGVLLYAALMGLVSRALWEWWRTHAQGNPGVHLVFAAALPFIIVLQRGNVSDTLARATFFVLPICVVLWLASRPVQGVGH